MTIEEKIFKKTTLIEKNLIPYGFKKENNNYVYKKQILDNSFEVIVTIDNKSIKGKIIDLSFNDEYNTFRIEGIKSEIANKVKDEFIKILNDIKENCFNEKYFVYSQTNRIVNLIIKKYNDYPEFLWNKYPGYGIFRNKLNEKWYAIIMNINKNKIISKENDEIEILNLKLNKNKVNNLLKQKGFYQAYHMNKENWITIILDDTISDDEILKLIIESHQNTEISNEWIIPSNPKYYDIINCFNDTDNILWKQSNNMKVNDIVYIYVGNPYSKILYKCQVLEVDIPYNYQDKNLKINKVMKIKLLRKYDNECDFQKLKEFGVTSIRGPRRIPEKLSEYLGD